MVIIGKFLHYIYCRPLNTIVMWMVLLLLIWGFLSYIASKKFAYVWLQINEFLLIIHLIGIICICIIFRSNTPKEVILIPFHSFIEAQTQREIYRSMLMNIFFFLPIGLTLPIILPDRMNHKVLVTIIFAAALSICIETVQFIFSLGRAETDDVLCNTLGAAIGALSYIFSVKLTHFRAKDRN